MKITKHSLSALLLAAIMVLAAGCQTQTTKDIDVAGLASHLNETLEFQDQLAALDSQTILTLYELEAGDVANTAVYASTGATAEEIAVLEAADESKVSKLQEAVNQRIETKKEDFEGYLPAEMKKLQDPVIRTEGNVVVLCISNDSDQANSAIDEYLK